MLLLIIFTLLFSYIYSQCPSPYTVKGGVCGYYHGSGNNGPYCAAWQYCEKINGRLAKSSEVNVINTFVGGQYYYVWIGMTALLNERFNNKNGWLWIDGKVTDSTTVWSTHWLDNNAAYDCGVFYVSGVGNYDCSRSAFYFCVYDNTLKKPYSAFVKSATVFNINNQVGCQELSAVSSRIHCGVKCSNTRSCVSYYYSDLKKQCMIMKYVDSALPSNFTNDGYNWERFN